VLIALSWGGLAAAQDLVLNKDCAQAFERFIQMAQSGGLGDGISNANVGVFATHARVELLRPGKPTAVLVLRPKRSPHMISRYFDVEPQAHAGGGDLERVGRALDQVFREDPFQIPGTQESIARGPLPGPVEAWTYGGWRGVLRMLERRMMSLASLRYVVAIAGALVLGVCACLVLLWGGDPPTRSEHGGSRAG
jgi:hypothetical protein